MNLHSLYLRNFRNFAEAEVVFSPRLNLLYGENGQGKTNLLEAIYLIATGRSFRTAHLHELIRSGESFFFLEAKIQKEGFEHTVQVSFDGTAKKLTLDGNRYSTLQHLLGLLPSVLHTAWDGELVDGSPALRRRFLNMHLAQRDPLYIHHLARYWRAMKQRNVLLRSEDPSIECWEIEMVESAHYLGKKRRELIDSLQAPFQEKSKELSSGKEAYEIRFQTSASENYAAQLKKNRPREKHLGATLAGPHRDDFSLWIDKNAARSFASEGQKKTAVFGLRLAELELFSDALLGIDDISLHLDEKRLALFRKTLEKQNQVLITSPSNHDLASAKKFVISAGSVL